MPKIVIIGAGSATFGAALLGDLFSYPIHFRDCEIWLVDTDPQALDTIARFAGRINLSQGQMLDIRASTQRRDALPEADFVILTVAVNRLAAWQRDWQIPLKHGVRHVLGENGGPGGLSHALRSIPLALEIARDVDALAPNALLLNFSHPLSRVCMAIHSHTRVRVAGLSRNIDEGYLLVNRMLGIVKAKGSVSDGVQLIERRIHITAAGLNRFSFMLAVQDRLTGEDLYPRLRAAAQQQPAEVSLMSRRLLDAFGLLCASGDLYAGEFLGFAGDTQPLSGYDFAAHAARHAARWRHVRAVAAGATPVAPDDVQSSGQRAFPIIAAIMHGLSQTEWAVNLPNAGLIDNLQADAIVEVPAMVDASGLRGVAAGALPRGLAAMLRREVDIQQLVVGAAINGDRRLALQALLLDPTVRSYAQATHMLDDLLDAHRAYLPRFFE